MNTTNQTSSISKRRMEFMNRSLATIAVETSILLLIALIAIGGNLLVVISIYRNRSLRTITNYFVLSLAMTDILFPTLSLPLSLYWSIQDRFTSTPGTCEFQAVLNTSLVWVSVSNLLFMAINRFVRVCKPQKYKKVFSRNKALIMIVVIWVGSFFSSALYLKGGLELVRARFNPSNIACRYVYQATNVISMIITNITICLALFLPCATIFYCYLKVFMKIREHKKNIAPASNPNSLGTSIQEIKVTWTVFSVLIGYLLTWIPALLLALTINLFFERVKVPRQVRMITIYSASSSCAINPVIYGLMNPGFRQECKKIFKLM
ncbi:melatonin receptor type 1A-like [Actinia tenebrosa]|uniref:Melatonin receptor type 1A-like n=1 Tax=Actinia tenebrosa TaxID=6105 RepID=A0A6P8GX67_ACTTE|nr:melatonin receptor type 1A-like [Actinia tenebrosa]